MILRLKIVIIFMILSATSTSTAQELKEYEADEIVITAGRHPVYLSNTGRSMNVITRNELKNAPVDNIQDFLNYIGGIDLMKRGPQGIQAEAGIRGGSFAQTLILLDGIKISDPQTAHHNLNLPVVMESIERIEVLKGHGSGVYGAGAFAGVINIITKKAGKNFNFNTSAGSFGYKNGTASLAYRIRSSLHRISFAAGKSDGYIPDSDFENRNLFYNSSFNSSNGSINLSAGINDKKYGASTFYSDHYPNEWEHTTTGFLGITSDLNINNIKIYPKLYYRRHKDIFLLDRDRPDWYRNEHKTDVYGAEIFSSIKTDFWGTFSVGSEIYEENINSSNLGDHSRILGGMNIENYFSLSKLSILIKVNAQYYSKWGWKIWPGLDLNYKANKTLSLRGSAGSSFRMPSFTELYYVSPSNTGNPELKYEKAVTFETGLDIRIKNIHLDFTVFRRNGRNLIDWIRFSPEDPWEAGNFARINTGGMETGLKLFAGENSFFSIVRLNYTYLNSGKNSAEYESKYIMNYLKHQVCLNTGHKLPFGFTANWNMNWKHRNNSKIAKYLVVDGALYRNYKNIRFYVKETNIFNTDYYEASGVQMPGRWVIFGFSLTGDFKQN